MGIKRGVHVPTEDDIKDGITYDKMGRMQYHPDFHPNHGKPFSEDDLEYLCTYYNIDHVRTLAFALGKTEHTLRSKIDKLKRTGKVEYYREQYFKKINQYEQADCHKL